MSKHLTLGAQGEDLAAAYLKSNKYRIIERNYRCKLGEVDIIARAPDRVLVFVEVKTLRTQGPAEQSLQPEDHLTLDKIRRLRRLAEYYIIHENPSLKYGACIDGIAIAFLADDNYTLRHIQQLEEL